MKDKSEQNVAFPQDLELYQDFVSRRYEDTSLHPVFGLVRNNAYLLGKRFGQQPDVVQDLIQSAVKALLSTQYKGRCPLGAYIFRIIRNELSTIWKKNGEDKSVDLSDDDPQLLLPSREDEIIRRISSEEFMRKLLSTTTGLPRLVATMIAEHDGNGCLSRNSVFKLLEGKYKRQQIINAYVKLRVRINEIRRESEPPRGYPIT